MHYRNLVDLAKSIGPDVAQLNDLAPKMAVPRIDASITKGIIHSALEERFWGVWTSLGGPPLQREVRFHPTRRWRFDFVVIGAKIAFEVQGGLHSAQSGHRSKKGVERDYEKANFAALAGWTVFFVTASAIDDTPFMEQLIRHCR